MKKRILNKIQLCTFVLLTLLNIAVAEGLGSNTENNFQPVPPDQMSGILTMISNETQSNYDKIKIWQGKVDVTIGRIYEGTKAERVFKNQINGEGEVPKKVKRLVGTTVFFESSFFFNSLTSYNYIFTLYEWNVSNPIFRGSNRYSTTNSRLRTK